MEPAPGHDQIGEGEKVEQNYGRFAESFGAHYCLLALGGVQLGPVVSGIGFPKASRAGWTVWPVHICNANRRT